jgi:hypothetical protein
MNDSATRYKFNSSISPIILKVLYIDITKRHRNLYEFCNKSNWENLMCLNNLLRKFYDIQKLYYLQN